MSSLSLSLSPCLSLSPSLLLSARRSLPRLVALARSLALSLSLSSFSLSNIVYISSSVFLPLSLSPRLYLFPSNKVPSPPPPHTPNHPQPPTPLPPTAQKRTLGVWRKLEPQQLKTPKTPPQPHTNRSQWLGQTPKKLQETCRRPGCLRTAAASSVTPP